MRKSKALGVIVVLVFLSVGSYADVNSPDEKPCATCVTKGEVIALAKERAKNQGYDVSALKFDVKWNGKVWYVMVETNSNTPGSHFAYEYGGSGSFVRLHGGA